ncbi:MAG: prepilin-type N-terminal cleavage/methylation domain-containing protein [Candidatus Pacebacteria bacterium]|nr:prepilin-type N-terminal cleavage/methylation domain-containing protein [Candidatus Paceibacterota bacterium]
MRTKSFTLIEVIAVISIIAIMASIIVYGIGEWKEDANLKKTIAYANEVKSKLGASLIAEWKMEDANIDMIYDSGRLGITGTREGTFTRETNCPEGSRCIYSNYAEIDFSASPALKFKTICFWVKSSNASFDIINSDNDFHIYSNSGVIAFDVYSADEVYTSIPFAGTAVNDNDWHFICGTVDDDSTFYGIVDGEVKATGSAGVSNFGRKPLSNMVIGGDANSFYLDDLIVFEDSIF